MLKYLRIAVTALSLTACVLLVALWVRSHQSRDLWRLHLTLQTFEAESALGQFGVFTYRGSDEQLALRWIVVPIAVDPCHPADNRIGFKAYCRGRYAGIVVPHWLLILLSAITTTAVVVRYLDLVRFSLRTLLIATTLVAVVLGVVVAAR